MATKRQADREADKRGFVLWEPGYDRRNASGYVTIDAAGSGQIDGECRGHVVSGYWYCAGDFWDEVITEMRNLGRPSGKCEDPFCDFHCPPDED